MAFFLPEQETLGRDGIASVQRGKLASMLGRILGTNRFYRRKLGGLDAADAADSFSSLPFTTRAELQQDQADHPPHGTNLTEPVERYSRLHQTSGSTGAAPLCVLDTAEDWEGWKRCWGVIYRAAGVKDADRLIFPFSFGPFIGFWAAFDGAAALGNLCLPAGGMTTAARLRFLLDHGVTFVCCTPTYALRMAEAASAGGIDLAGSAVRGLIVAGEPGGSLAATRGAIERAWGARVFDHAGMTEVGPYGFECEEAPGGMHVNEIEFIAEVIDAETGAPVGDGAEGELVLTNLFRRGFPLIRYRTGDRARLTRGRCRCGRHFARLEGGLLGRADDMFFVRGNNVYPAAVEDIVRGVTGVAEFRATLRRRASMIDLRIEVEPSAGVDAAAACRRVTEAIQDRLNFKPTVVACEPGSLPRYEMKARRWTISNEAGE